MGGTGVKGVQAMRDMLAAMYLKALAKCALP